MEALCPDSVPVVVESISSEQHPKGVTKITVVTEKVPVRQDMKHVHPLVQDLLPQEKSSDLPVAGRLKHFLENWKKLTNNPQILELVEGFSNPIFINTKAYKSFQPSLFNKKGRIPGRIRNSSNVKKRCHLDGGEISEPVIKSNIFGGENHNVEGHIDFRIAESVVCNKLSKICFEPFSSDSIFRCKNRFPYYVASLPLQKKEQIIAQC